MSEIKQKRKQKAEKKSKKSSQEAEKKPKLTKDQDETSSRATIDHRNLFDESNNPVRYRTKDLAQNRKKPRLRTKTRSK